MNPIKYIYNFILNGWSFVHKKEKCAGYPPIIAIEPTNACMMKCIMCPRQYMKRKIGFMDINLFKKIIDQTRGCTNMVSLELFGDALLHPKIEEMISYLHKKGILSQISTNPMSLSDKNINKILNSELDILLLSLDAIDDKTYKKYRGNFANYNFAVKQINKLISKKIEMKKKKPFIDIRMIGLPGLKEHFQEYKKQWNKPGVDKVSMKEFHTFGGTVKKIAGSKIKQTKWASKGICYKPWEGLHVMWDGRVVPCCFDYDGKVILGDLNKETLEEVWNNKTMQELRKACLTGKFGKNNFCKNCKERTIVENKYGKATKLFPFDKFFLKYLISYLYQRNQNKKIVKFLRNII